MPGLDPGIQPTATADITGWMDPGNKCRDDKLYDPSESNTGSPFSLRTSRGRRLAKRPAAVTPRGDPLRPVKRSASGDAQERCTYPPSQTGFLNDTIMTV